MPVACSTSFFTKSTDFQLALYLGVLLFPFVCPLKLQGYAFNVTSIKTGVIEYYS